MSKQMPASTKQSKKVLPVGHYRGLGAWTIVFFVFLYLPIVVLIFYSFNANRMVMNWGGFGIDWYLKAFQNEDIHKAVWNSLIVAIVSTIFATAIATIGALVLARGGNFRGKTISLGLITLPLMVPEIVTAVAVLIFFSAIGMNLGLGNVIIAHITFCIPFAFMPIRARFVRASKAWTRRWNRPPVISTRRSGRRFVISPCHYSCPASSPAPCCRSSSRWMTSLLR